MLRYLLKRLLLILPIIWLISSLVFLLSRTIPGSYADRMAEAEQATISGANVGLNRKTYLQQLQKEGQDKPLFYFSICSRAQPDTLDRVFPVQHQKLLEELLNRYGNWPRVAAYYQSVSSLPSGIDAPDKSILLQEKKKLFLQAVNLDAVAALLQELQPAIADNKSAGEQVILRFIEMQQQAKTVNLLVPDFRWHGLQNQYHTWLTGFMKGNLGKSYRDQESVLFKIREALANTLLLLAGSLLLTFLLSIELSLVLCNRPKGRTIILTILYVLDSIPLFIVALLLLTLLLGSGYLNISSVLGFREDVYSSEGVALLFLNRLQQLLLPALCLILAGMPYITAQLYQVLQQVSNSEFIKAARAKGLSETRVLRKHALRNALLPLITLFTGYLPALISGAVVIEVIFAIPGTGRLLTESVLARDYPVVIGLVLFLAALKAFSHVLADILYFAADPRTRSNAA